VNSFTVKISFLITVADLSKVKARSDSVKTQEKFFSGACASSEKGDRQVTLWEQFCPDAAVYGSGFETQQYCVSTLKCTHSLMNC
jgi:hypothetical protein